MTEEHKFTCTHMHLRTMRKEEEKEENLILHQIISRW